MKLRGNNMMHAKMRGIADPYSLGIIITILGGIVVNFIHSPKHVPEQVIEMRRQHVTHEIPSKTLAGKQMNEPKSSSTLEIAAH